MAAQAARWRPDLTKLADPAHAARLALHSIAACIQALSAEIAALERQLSILVKRAAPKTLKVLGVGPIHAAQMLITAGQNIDRIHSETAFAPLCAADPIQPRPARPNATASTPPSAPI